MACHENYGKAVQILQLNDDHSFSLNESQLEAILLDDRVKDKPVAVVSVAGTYRQGKSFLLAFFLRFFQNKCQSEWLDNPRIPLGGFEWKPGSSLHTTGILLWSVPVLETGVVPFQRLVFLVRDWPFNEEADFGAEGGHSVLQECLKIMDEQHDELRGLQRQIWSCFSQIDCFLMPRPGDKVETDYCFEGSLMDVDNNFKQKVQELVHWLLAPENLVPKKMNGQKITCEELMKYFRAYAAAFQGGTLPSPKTVLQATAEASNMVAKEKATNFYLDAMNRIPRGDLDKLLESHAELLEETTQLFKRTPKFGDESVSQSYLGALTTDLLMHFERIYKQEEQFFLIEKGKDEQRQRERETERQREEVRQREREIHRVKEEEWALEMESEIESEYETQEAIEQMQLIVSKRQWISKQISRLSCASVVITMIIIPIGLYDLIAKLRKA
ncbi:atlastin-1-like isoform X2 [Amblyomma americanum]